LRKKRVAKEKGCERKEVMAQTNPATINSKRRLTCRMVLNGVECGTGGHPEKLTLPEKDCLPLLLPITANLQCRSLV